MKEDFFIKSDELEIVFSMSVRHKERALKADAEEAIPLLCGNVLVELILIET